MLLPREHGAYGQLLFPRLSALLIGRPAPGARALHEQGGDARRSVALFGGFCAVTGAVSLFVLPRPALIVLFLPALLVLLVGAAVAMHRERSTLGEMLAAVALSSLSLPVALAGNATRTDALTLFVVCSAVFVTATIAVRALIGRVTKAGGPPPLVAGGLTLLVVVGLAAAAFTGTLAPVAPSAALPVCGLA